MLSYLQYAAETENRDGLNSFDVTRAYLNINAQLASRVRFRFTPDIRRITDGSLAGSLTLRVKYAFGQLDTLGREGSWARFGLHQTPWLDFEESINRYRVQGTMFAEREGLIPGSADFGASYFTPLPGGFGEVHGGVFNGEGFTQAGVEQVQERAGETHRTSISKPRARARTAHHRVLQRRLVRSGPTAASRDRDGQLRASPSRRHAAACQRH